MVRFAFLPVADNTTCAERRAFNVDLGARCQRRRASVAAPATDPDYGVRWVAGDALERIADESVVDELIAIARDRRHGSTRGLAVAAFGNMRKAKDRVLAVLLEPLDDQVAMYAIKGLRKLKAPESRA